MLSRRKLLKSGATLGGLGVLLATGGCEALRDAIANRPLRRRVGSTGSAGDVAIYADAVAQMKALPSSDPRNWDNQAAIHQNFCPHGNWYFLPWHRAYLYYFERICRELTGEEDFGLPYWNWQVNRAIPADFWSGTLDDNTRSISSSDQASTSYVGQSVIQDILDLTNFEQFGSYADTALRGGSGGGYGSLEGTPHNNIHGFIGGNMGGYLSPLDPVFWCHHNMIDCLWDSWNNKYGNLNTSDSSWTGFDLSGMFVDGDGSAASMTCGLTTILPLISYRFSSSTKGDDLIFDNFVFSREVLQAGGNIRHSILRRTAIGGRVEIGANNRITRSVKNQSILERSGTDQVLVQFDGVRGPTDDNGYLRVFVNMPDANSSTSINSPNYAGSIGFFMDSKMRMRMPDTYFVDISATLERLKESGQFSANDGITLNLVHVPHAFEGRQLGSVRLGTMSLVTTPRALKGQ